VGKILLTNDDGINSEGLFLLWEKLRELGDVVVVAPDSERSGCGHALTLKTPLQYRELRKDGKVYAYSTSGTPVDCVRLAFEFLFKGEIDLVVAGINNGANIGINLHYSGTVAAALEAAILGICGVAVSIASPSPDSYEPAAVFGANIVEVVMKSSERPIVLNVNVPAKPVREIKGVLITRQALTEVESDLGTHIEAHAINPDSCEKDSKEDGVWYDTNAIRAGYVSVTPLGIDLTRHSQLSCLSELKARARYGRREQ
jgi:5'-nucleotidase